ncbi:MAG: 3-oxoacyl-[acyl-carrier-protein] reductase [Alicyclobacillaceae bacterium]|nr:3-oxoacyl-[acyl-carrier-protein] reductase [Alicyclobacillus sp. SP_1]MCY0886904.1 3-oxoacyl-[acyl-carrier-protein] reductase [Alicyclobacillaceae bacterium]MCY0895895.1 3-oxoacyl-[acyl-carrier-protein] reductase [Alicyclobacillaceae bacterium]
MGKVSLVTGSSRGIGRAIAVELAAGGGQVVVNYAGRVEAAEETARLVRAAGGEALLVQANVRQVSEVERLVQCVLERFGRIDVLVNNAGVTRDGLLVRMKDSDWDEVLETNLRAAFYVTREVARPMMKARYGRIINIASVVGVIGNPGQVNYVASKAGLIGLTKSVAKELAPRHITVNAIAPGWIETDMTEALSPETLASMRSAIPLGRPGKPEDVAAAVGFLASEQANYITGQVLHIDGGMAM